MKKRRYGVSLLSGLALVASQAVAGQALPKTPQHHTDNPPMDADDGLELAEPSLDRNGLPLAAGDIAERKKIADCLLGRFKSIPRNELEDYTQTVSFYLPHKVTAVEEKWIEQRIYRAVAETLISRHSSAVESFVMKPTRTSLALEYCLAPKPEI